MALRPIKKLQIYVALLVIVGCAPRMAAPGGLAGAPAAPAAVERFLQLAAAKDYNGMGWIFGTADGPIFNRDRGTEVEQRMYALASLLEHDSFVVGSPSPVPGRSTEAFQFEVVLLRGGQTFRVPFTTVRGPGSRWFVEQLRVDAMTSGG